MEQSESPEEHQAAPQDAAAHDDASRWPNVLLALTTVLAILAVVTVWTRIQLLDTDEWVDRSTELLDQPEVVEALSRTIVDALYEENTVRDGLEERLPDELDGVAGFVAGALRDPITSAVQRVIESPLLQGAWEAANRRAHETLVAVLRGDDLAPGLTTSDGEVALELRTVVVEVGESLGLPTDKLERIPEDAGRIVLFESDDLEAAQSAVRVFEVLAWFLFVTVVAAYAALVITARTRRLMLRNVGISRVRVGVVVLLIQGIAQRILVDALVERPENEASAVAVGEVATGLIRQMAWSAVAYGLLVLLFAALTGSHRWAVTTRRALAPAFRRSPAIAGGTALLILVLWWWSPGRVFAGWTTALVFVGLIIAAVVGLRQRILTDPEVADGVDVSVEESEQAEPSSGEPAEIS